MLPELDGIDLHLTEDAANLELDPKHPGIGDPHYLRRRRYFFETARDYRLGEKGIPLIQYEPPEHEVWRYVSERLAEAHRAAACGIYLEGKEQLRISDRHIPQQAEMSAKLEAMSGLQLVPAEGLINFRSFFGYLSEKRMPCTQYVRHASKPEFTPEPDVVHDMIGHVPQLGNPEYVSLIQLIGRATQSATPQQLLKFNRLYWFTIEFGLIEERGETKVFGAGLLSSIGEMAHALSDEVTVRPFNMEEVVRTDYDPSRMQDLLFLIPSLEALSADTEALVADFEAERNGDD